MDRSQHTVTKNLSDEKTQGTIKNKTFKRLGYINDQLYEVEFVRSVVENTEPIIVGFFVLQNAKMRILELHYSILDNNCDVTKYEELEMDTDLLYLALTERLVWFYPTKNETGVELFAMWRLYAWFSSQLIINFFVVLAALNIISTIHGNMGYWKEISAAQKKFVCVANKMAVLTHNQTKSDLAAKAWTKERSKNVVMAPCPNIVKFWKNLLM